MEDKTIEYYNNNAKKYADSTINADMSITINRFLNYVVEHGSILDAGCGSGRDSKYFMDEGYEVTSFDGSQQMCELASAYLKKEVRCLKFENLDYNNQFDGIWACASLLHVNKNDLPEIITKLKKALKNNGIIYATFKYGSAERTVADRYFNDMNENTVKELFDTAGIEILEIFIDNDVRKDRSSEKWINVIGKKA